nr:hypothetical protein [Variovorax sp. OK605]
MTSLASLRCASASALLTTSVLTLTAVLVGSVVSPVTSPRSTRLVLLTTGTCEVTSLPLRLTRTLSSATPTGAVISTSVSPPLIMSGGEESVLIWSAAGVCGAGEGPTPGMKENVDASELSPQPAMNSAPAIAMRAAAAWTPSQGEASLCRLRAVASMDVSFCFAYRKIRMDVRGSGRRDDI